MKRFPGTEK